MTIFLVVISILAVLCLVASAFSFLHSGKIGHSSFLLVGFIYYVLLPYWAFTLDWYQAGPGEEIWRSAFARVIQYSGFFAFFYLVVFLLPYLTANSHYFLPKKPLTLRPLYPKSPQVFILFSSLIHAVNLFNLVSVSHLIGSGYSIEYQWWLYGPICSSSLILLLLYLYLSDLCRKAHVVYLSFIRSVSLIVLVVNSLALISLGVRAYAVIILISILTYSFLSGRSPYNDSVLMRSSTVFGTKIYSRFFVLILVPIMLTIIVLIGLWRQNIINIYDQFLNYLISESLLTSISISFANPSCVQGNQLILSYPYEIAHAFFGLVPRFLLPDKNLIFSVDRPCLVSPFGAQHITASLLVGIGVLGASILVFFFSIYLKLIQVSSRLGSHWLYAYVCACSVSFVFRETFPNSIRVIFLYPLIFYLIINLVIRMKFHSPSGLN